MPSGILNSRSSEPECFAPEWSRLTRGCYDGTGRPYAACATECAIVSALCEVDGVGGPAQGDEGGGLSHERPRLHSEDVLGSSWSRSESSRACVVGC